MFDVSKRLQQLMDERGLNMHSLAKRSNLSWNTIKNLYSRDTKPTIYTLSMLCDGLGITLAQFFDTDGCNIRLNAEQSLVVQRWDRLSGREKKLLLEMMNVLLEKRR